MILEVITKIKKRDGRVAPFEKEKISIAIGKAFQSVDEFSKASVEKITDEVVNSLEVLFQNTIPSVEDVQDLVEKSLIANGVDRVA